MNEQNEKHYKNSVRELLETEKTFIDQLENLVSTLNILKEHTQLPKELSFLIYLDEIILEYNQLIKALKKSSLYSTVQKTNLNDFDANAVIESLEKNFLPNGSQPGELNTVNDVLGYMANNYDYLSSSLSHFESQINRVVSRILGSKCTADITKINEIHKKSNIKDFIASVFITPVQRIGRYDLLFKDIYKHKPTETMSDLSVEETKKLTEWVEKKNKKRVKAITKSTIATNKKLTPNDKKLLWIPSKRSMWTMISEENKSTSVGQVVRTLDEQNERYQHHTKQYIIRTLNLLNSWLQDPTNLPFTHREFSISHAQIQPKSNTIRHIAENLRNRLHESYFLLKIPSQENIKAIIEMHSDLIAKRDPQCSLITKLKELDKPSAPREDSQSAGILNKPLDENKYIYFPIIDLVLERINNYRHFNSGNSWRTPLSLDSNLFDELTKKIKDFKSQLNQTTREDFCITLVKIFRDSLHRGGIFPKHFLKGEFGKFLREVADYIDQFKPTAYRPALELITAPEGYNPAPPSQRKLINPADRIFTPAVLCGNIQRIMDFYCDYDLHLIVAENIEDGYEKKHSSNRRWTNVIQRLDKKITNIYLKNQKNTSVINTLTSMLKEIFATIDEITNTWWFGGGNSALAGTLYDLADQFIKDITKKDPNFKLPEFESLSDTGRRLAEGVTTFDSDFDFEGYIFKHIAQCTSKSFVDYYDTVAQRVKPTVPAKLTHTGNILQALNQVYLNPFNAPTTTVLQKQSENISNFSSPTVCTVYQEGAEYNSNFSSPSVFTPKKQKQLTPSSPQPHNPNISTPSKFSEIKEIYPQENITNAPKKTNVNAALVNFWKIRTDFLPDDEKASSDDKKVLPFNLSDQHKKAFIEAKEYLADIGLDEAVKELKLTT